MDPDYLDVFLRMERASSQSLDWLMDQIFNGDNSAEAAAQLKRLANLLPDEFAQPHEAMQYYRGMRRSLSEEDFRWLSLGMPPQPALRRERLAMYRRYRELFEIELAFARKLRRSTMALSRDWSGLGDYTVEMVNVARYKGMLSAAGVLFRWRIPGALDLCDAAAFGLFRMLYLRPVA